MELESFTVDIPDQAISDLRARLRSIRWPADFNNEDWRYGVPRSYLESFVESWLAYDWRETESQINSFDNYRITMDGMPIHFMHARGKGPDPVPIILTHGWPWSFWDWQEVVRRLTDPAAFGGDPADSFDVVVPSLPGFGFSTPLTVDGVQTQWTADLWARLMTDILGYEHFAAAGGDFGSAITAQLGHKYADRVIGIHVSIPPLLGASGGSGTAGPEPGSLLGLRAILDGPTARLDRDDFEPDERSGWDMMDKRWPTALAHVAVHTTDPQTFAYALHDSPVGLAAWIIEKRYNWSDSSGGIENVPSRRFLLDLVSIYWFTESFVTSARWYWHVFRTPWDRAHDRKPAIEVPVGVAGFPHEMVFAPRKMVEENNNLTYWGKQERGGHFPAAEEPDLFARDVTNFFRSLR
jgi:pimeloyl-ACP methyl ester carboxylesterase